MMRVLREEALDLFGKWQTEKSLLRCDFSVRRVVARLNGRVVDLSDDRVQVLSDDTSQELLLPLPASLDFGYGEPRDFPEEGEEYERGLVILFPAVGSEEADIISFSEMKATSEF